MGGKVDRRRPAQPARAQAGAAAHLPDQHQRAGERGRPALPPGPGRPVQLRGRAPGPLRAHVEGHRRAAGGGARRLRARGPHRGDGHHQACLTWSCSASSPSSCWRWCSTSPTASTTPPTRSPPWSPPGSWPVPWNSLPWWLGLPPSSSPALIGGFAGAGVAKAGFSVLNAASLEKTILFIFLSPLIGMTLGFLLMLANLWLFRRATPARVDSLFRRLQLLSAAAFSLGHGGNDAQKTMGIIAALRGARRPL